MIGPRPHLRDLARRTRFEFAVFEHGEVDATKTQPSEVDGDAALDRPGINRVRQVPGLLALHQVDVLDRVMIAAVGAPWQGRALAVFTPQVAVAHIVIVGNGDRGPITDDFAKLQAELDPARRVLRVAVGLVAGKEQQVGILPLQVLGNLGPLASRAARVAGHVRDDDLVLVDRIAANPALERRYFAVPDPVPHVLRCVPGLEAKMRVPAWIEHFGPCNFGPVVVAPQFQTRDAFLARLEGEELRGHLQHAVVAGVNSKRDDLVARYIHRRRRGSAGAGLALAVGVALRLRAGAFRPPAAGRQ